MRIPFGPGQGSGLEALAGASPVAFNVIVESTGAVRRRPGVAFAPEAPIAMVDSNGIAALHQTESQGLVAVGGSSQNESSIYRIMNQHALDLSVGEHARKLLGARRPSIVETEMLLVLAAGGAIQKVQLSDWQSARLGGSPPQASHLSSNSLRLLANDIAESRTSVRYSDLAIGLVTYEGHETWVGGTAGSFQAEARPDPVVALADTANEVFVFGSKTLQVYGPDETFVFAPVIGLEVGCIAPDSVVRVDGQLFWLDHNRAFVASAGRQVQQLSPPLAQTLANLSVVDDCFGFRCRTGRMDAVCWTFPTDGRTFVLQQNGGWGQWSTGTSHGRLSFQCAHNTAGRCLVGLRDGRIGELSASAHDDLGDPIAAHATTGFLNNDTDAHKHCEAVRLAIRHEFGSQGLVWLDYRDDLGAWNSLPVELDGSRGELTQVEFRGLGTYRRRQWRVRFEQTSEVVLAMAEADVRVV